MTRTAVGLLEPDEVEREYHCRCGQFLLRARPSAGILRDLYCRGCRARVTVDTRQPPHPRKSARERERALAERRQGRVG